MFDQFFTEMDKSLWSEKTCSSLISDLPLWIIEHAWRNRMIDVLEVLGPPLWLDGDWSCLSLDDPWSIRVVAAEAWMVVRVRDIKHFERVIKLLDVLYTLLPHLVTSIKHMKIMFGLKTLVIMWMLWDDQSVASITDKLMRFFPENLSQYRGSSRRHMELMQKAQKDFVNFVLTLAKNTDMRKTYIRDMMEERYGESYALKLEERLLRYLEELDKALPQPTHIDQVLKQSWPMGEREELLQQLLTINTTSVSTALKRLLRCAIANHFSHSDTETCRQREKGTQGDRSALGPSCVAFKPSQERTEEMLSQTCLQGLWLNKNKRLSLLQKGSEKIYLERQIRMLNHEPDQRPQICQVDMDPCVVEEQDFQRAEPGLAAEQDAEKVTTEHLCSRHGKKMKSILLECSEELKGQDRQAPLIHSECTPPSPLTPLLQSTPYSLTQSLVSPLQDSSSTNISLCSNQDSSSTNVSGLEAQLVGSSQVSSGQLVISSLKSPVQKKSTTLAVQRMRTSGGSISLEQVLPTLFQSTSFQQISPSPVSSVHALTSQISLPKASSSVQQESLSTVFSLHPPLSRVSSTLVNLAENYTTLASASTAHDISPLATFKPSVPQESSPPTFSVHKNLCKTTASVGQQPGSSLNSFSSAAPSPSCNSEQAAGTIIQDLDAVSESNTVLGGKLKLSLETQGVLLFCKWLQPQVLLCRLSQQECPGTTLPEGTNDPSSEEEEEVNEDREENESFDVNLLYSDSDSDTQECDDPDYVPSKKFKA